MGQRYAVALAHSTFLSRSLLLGFVAHVAGAAADSAGSRLAGTFQIKTAIVRARLDRPFICIQSCSKQRRSPTEGCGSCNNGRRSKHCATMCNVSAVGLEMRNTHLAARGM